MTTTPSTSAPPPQPAVAVELFSTSILSNHKVRSRHERFVSVLQVKKIPFVYHDLASDELAKKRWRRVALDAQIPGLLVHSEWRGTFEEFEEAIEFGELDLFLRIDAERARREADEGIIPQPAPQTLATPRSASSTNATKPRKASKHVVKTVPALAQPRAPSMTTLAPALPMAAPQEASEQGTSRSTLDTERFMRSIGLTDMTLTEEELNEVLQAGSSDAKAAKVSGEGGEQADRGEGKYTNALGLGTPSSKGGTTVPRTYVPSAEAGVKPLRLAKMGNGDSAPRSSSSTPAAVVPHARYNASQISSRALTAEAQASAASRAFSSTKLREAVAQGDDLKAAMSQTRLASNTDSVEQIVGREDIDDLLASLGLNDVKMTDEEAEQFLFEGAIPEGMGVDGTRLGRSDSAVDRARNETAAREVALRARQKGHGSSTSLVSSKSGGDSARQSSDDEATYEEAHDDVAATTSKEETAAVSSPVSTNEETQSSTDTILGKVLVAHEPLVGLREEKAGEGEEETTADAILEEKIAEMSLETKPKEGKAEDGDIEKEEVSSLSDPAKEKEPSPPPPEDAKSAEATKPSLPASPPAKVEEEQFFSALQPGKDSVAAEKEADRTEHDLVAPQTTPKQGVTTVLADLPTSPKQQLVETHITPKRRISGKVAESPTMSHDAKDAVTPSRAMPTQSKALPAAPALPVTTPPSAQPTFRVQRSSSSPVTSPTKSPSQLPPLELDSSFSEVASLIQVDDKNDVPDSIAPPSSSLLLSPNSAPAQSDGFDDGQLDVLQHSSSPMSAPATSDALHSITGRRKTLPLESNSSPTSRSSTSSRRRGLDVQRKSVGSSASERALSPASSSRSVSAMPMPSRGGGAHNGTLSPRSVTQPLDSMAAYSPESQRSTKSPKSKLFSIGRRKSKDKRGGNKAEEEEEDIPTTTDPSLVDSRADYAARGGPPMDRSQKTLSVILREADEAMAGDDDGLGDDDVVGSFDFELDDDGIDVER